MQTKAILFDLDGVILDSEKEYRRFWMQAAEELGYPLTEDVVLRLRSCDSSIARKIVDEAAGESGAYDRVRARRKILMKDFLSEHTYELKPGVKAFLEKCRELPVRKVIVTSSRPEEKMPELERLGIGQYFDSFVLCVGKRGEAGQALSGCLSLCLQEAWDGTGRVPGDRGFAERGQERLRRRGKSGHGA